MGAASNRGDELFGEEEFVYEAGGTVELGELAFFFVGAHGHGDDVTDAAEEAEFHGDGIVTGEIIEMKIEKQNVGSVFDCEMQSVVEISRDGDDVSRAFGLQHSCDEATECGAVVGD